MSEKERALRDTLASLGSVVVAYSGGVDSAYLACVANDTLGDRAARRHRRQPELSGAAPADRHRHRRASSACATRSSTRSELEQPEYRANPANRCYFCKHELYTHLTRIAAERARDRRRRQQRRRSRRLSSRAPGGARVRRPQPARRSGSRKGRDPRAVAPRRPADMGRAGVRVPVVAHPVSSRSDGREAPHDRARRAGAARARVPRVPRAPPRRAGAHRDRRATRCRARSSPRRARRIVRELKALGYRLRDDRSAGLSHRAA